MSAIYTCLNCRCTQVAKSQPRNCIKCSAGAVWLRSEAELPGFAGADKARASAMAQSEGEALTAKLREPVGGVSAKSGRMERESPLFFGKGDNPGLF